MESKLKKRIFIFLFIVLLLPATQHYFPFIKSAPLNGFSPEAPDVTFTLENWWNATYQQQKSKYINDLIGFRPDLIRLNNQLDYSLFHKLHAWKVVEGADRSIFMDTYIDAYFGRDYIGYDSMLVKMMKLKAISDTLTSLGKSLILVQTPAKEFMYPENIPKQYITRRTTTNVATCNRIGDSLNINIIDFNAWFCALKSTSKELLFTRQGAHWSVYGAYLAYDSLENYIESRRHIHMIHPKWSIIEHSSSAMGNDNDVAKTLNLIYPIAHETFSYPVVYYPEFPGMTKPRITYIGDSFLLLWINNGMLDHTIADWQAWQWFSILWSANSREGNKNVQESDWIGTIDNSDCIVLAYTAFNLPVLGNGFIEKAYGHYFPDRQHQ
jgi:hypothetical protein